MSTVMQKVVKALLFITVFVVLAGIVFTAGFGSAYVLSESGALPSLSGAAPSSTPPPAATDETPPVESPTPKPLPTPSSDDEATFQVFWEVWAIIQRDYYGDLPGMQDVTYAAIQGMLNAVNDPFTSFVTPQEAAIRAEDDSGEYEGIGAYVDMDEEGKLIIVAPFDGSPAEAAGLQPEDRIIAVDGVSIVGLSLSEMISKVRGPAGSEVVLTVEREGEQPFEVTVTRDRFELEISEAEMLENDTWKISWLKTPVGSSSTYAITRVAGWIRRWRSAISFSTAA
jgi:C-terminal processing protease CtpA/Prc